MAQDKYNDLIKQLKAARGETKLFEEAFKKITGPGREMDNLLKDMEIQLKGLHVEAEELNSSFGDMASTLANIVGELSKSDTATKSATKSYKGLLSIAQKMQYEEEGIYAYNVKQLDNLHSQAKAHLTNLQTSIDSLANLKNLSDEQQALLKAKQDEIEFYESQILELEKLKSMKTFECSSCGTVNVIGEEVE
jgi:chromosome segregation ATPase